MVANRFDSPRTGGEASEKPAVAPVPSATPEISTPQRNGAAWTNWLPLGLSMIIMPALAYAITTFVLVPKLRQDLAPAKPAAAAKKASTATEESEKSSPGDLGKESVSLNKLLVNVAGTLGSRYLLTSITLVGAGANFKTAVNQHDPQLRDVACGILSTKTIADLEHPGTRNLIRNELIMAFNNILGASAVQEIFFTEFAVQ